MKIISRLQWNGLSIQIAWMIILKITLEKYLTLWSWSMQLLKTTPVNCCTQISRTTTSILKTALVGIWRLITKWLILICYSQWKVKMAMRFRNKRSCQVTSGSFLQWFFFLMTLAYRESKRPEQGDWMGRGMSLLALWYEFSNTGSQLSTNLFSKYRYFKLMIAISGEFLNI